jgi:hypothetical protein
MHHYFKKLEQAFAKQAYAGMLIIRLPRMCLHSLETTFKKIKLMPIAKLEEGWRKTAS